MLRSNVRMLVRERNVWYGRSLGDATATSRLIYFFFIFCVLLPVPWEEKLMMPIVLFNSCCRYDTHFPSSGTDSVEVDYYNLMMFSKEHIQKK